MYVCVIFEPHFYLQFGVAALQTYICVTLKPIYELCNYKTGIIHRIETIDRVKYDICFEN